MTHSISKGIIYVNYFFLFLVKPTAIFSTFECIDLLNMHSIKHAPPMCPPLYTLSIAEAFLAVIMFDSGSLVKGFDRCFQTWQVWTSIQHLSIFLGQEEFDEQVDNTFFFENQFVFATN